MEEPGPLFPDWGPWPDFPPGSASGVGPATSPPPLFVLPGTENIVGYEVGSGLRLLPSVRRPSDGQKFVPAPLYEIPNTPLMGFGAPQQAAMDRSDIRVRVLALAMADQ